MADNVPLITLLYSSKPGFSASTHGGEVRPAAPRESLFSDTEEHLCQ
jgi:hypothetical protein